MITTTNTITIAIITIAIIIISPGQNTHTYPHNRWEAGTRFRRKVWVGDLLSPRSNCLPFLQNLRLPLSTPWPWDIMQYRRGGREKYDSDYDIDQCHDVDHRHLPHATRLPVASPCNSARLWIEHPGAYMGVYSQVILGVSCLLTVYLGACSGVYLRASWELTWERTVKQARSAPLSAIRSIFESTLGRVLENVLGGVLASVFRVYVGTSWELTS